MTQRVILASGSQIRRDLLLRAGVPLEVIVARIDEDSIKKSLTANGETPRSVADALAEAKSMRVSAKQPESLVLGCDQVLEFGGRVFSKPESPDDARRMLAELSGREHELHSAAVISEDGQPVWRNIETVRLFMREVSASYIDAYLERNWDSVRTSVGAYMIEEEGVRLFRSISGSHFAVLGLPLLEILSYLTVRGVIEG